jgi:RsiW-degrading membrane proteinase PrsW (M82 family)
MLIVLIAAILPAIVLIVHIYNRDKWQKEPPRQLFKAFVYGVGSAMIVLLLPTFGLVSVTPGTSISAQIGNAFSTAAIPEEMAKLFMLWLFLRKCKEFDEHMDAIVYAVCVGMGFAATENILYLFSNIDNWLATGIMRALISVPAHFFFAIIMGYYYSLAHFRIGKNRTLDAISALLIPVLAHGIFDALLFVSAMNAGMAGILTLIFIIGFFFLRKYASSRVDRILESDRIYITRVENYPFHNEPTENGTV